MQPKPISSRHRRRLLWQETRFWVGIVVLVVAVGVAVALWI